MLNNRCVKAVMFVIVVLNVNVLDSRTADAAFCGDGTTDAGEQCDDGGTLSGDSCTMGCQTETSLQESGRYAAYGSDALGADLDGNYLYVAKGERGLEIYHKDTGVLQGSYDTQGLALDVKVYTISSTSYAFVADDDQGIFIIDVDTVSDPQFVKQVTWTNPSAKAIDIFPIGGTPIEYAVVACENNGLVIFDVSSPGSPGTVYTEDDSGDIDEAVDVECGDVGGTEYAFIGDDSSSGAELHIIDISTPASPSKDADFSSSNLKTVEFDDTNDIVYISEYWGGVVSVDVSTPSTPAEVDNWQSVGNLRDFVLAGSYGFAGTERNNDSTAVTLLEVDSSGIITECDTYTTTDENSEPVRMIASGNELFVAWDENGVVNISKSGATCATATLSEDWHVDTVSFPARMDMEGDYLFVADNSGIQIVDTGSLELPVYESHIDADLWGANDVDVETISGTDYLFVALGADGIAAYNITTPGSPSLVASASPGDYSQGLDAYQDPDDSKWYVVLAHDDQGTRVYEFDASTPQFVLKDTLAARTNATVFSVQVVGDYAYLADTLGLWIVNIDTTTNISQTGAVNTTGGAIDVKVSGDYAFISDYGVGLVSIDISSKSSPSVSDTLSRTGDETGGLWLKDDMAYWINFTDNELIVVDISTPANLTYVEDYSVTEPTGVYENGGVVYVSSREEGIVIFNDLPGTICGDGFVNDEEQCDDGTHCENGTSCSVNSDCTGIGDALCKTRSGDGCGADCNTEIYLSWGSYNDNRIYHLNPGTGEATLDARIHFTRRCVDPLTADYGDDCTDTACGSGGTCRTPESAYVIAFDGSDRIYFVDYDAFPLSSYIHVAGTQKYCFSGLTDASAGNTCDTDADCAGETCYYDADFVDAATPEDTGYSKIMDIAFSTDPTDGRLYGIAKGDSYCSYCQYLIIFDLIDGTADPVSPGITLVLPRAEKLYTASDMNALALTFQPNGRPWALGADYTGGSNYDSRSTYQLETTYGYSQWRAKLSGAFVDSNLYGLVSDDFGRAYTVKYISSSQFVFGRFDLQTGSLDYSVTSPTPLVADSRSRLAYNRSGNCRDGTTASPEACDEGGYCFELDDDFTTSTCTADAGCNSDEVCRHKAVAESGATPGCSATCWNRAICGLNSLNIGETCDDGNTTSSDGCDSNCQCESNDSELCGTENCDDGNTAQGDSCDAGQTQLQVALGSYDTGIVFMGLQQEDGSSTMCDLNSPLAASLVGAAPEPSASVCTDWVDPSSGGSPINDFQVVGTTQGANNTIYILTRSNLDNGADHWWTLYSWTAPHGCLTELDSYNASNYSSTWSPVSDIAFKDGKVWWIQCRWGGNDIPNNKYDQLCYYNGSAIKCGETDPGYRILFDGTDADADTDDDFCAGVSGTTIQGFAPDPNDSSQFIMNMGYYDGQQYKVWIIDDTGDIVDAETGCAGQGHNNCDEPVPQGTLTNIVLTGAGDNVDRTGGLTLLGTTLYGMFSDGWEWYVYSMDVGSDYDLTRECNIGIDDHQDTRTLYFTAFNGGFFSFTGFDSYSPW